ASSRTCCRSCRWSSRSRPRSWSPSRWKGAWGDPGEHRSRAGGDPQGRGRAGARVLRPDAGPDGADEATGAGQARRLLVRERGGQAALRGRGVVQPGEEGAYRVSGRRRAGACRARPRRRLRGGRRRPARGPRAHLHLRSLRQPPGVLKTAVTSMLSIKNLSASVDGKAILNGLSLELPAGEVHAIMGPNGAGKSTLSYVLTGREGYEVTAGEVTLDGEDLLALNPAERSARGVFLSFQYPIEIPGVPAMTFLRTALNAQHKARGEPEIAAPAFLKMVREKAAALRIDPDMLRR